MSHKIESISPPTRDPEVFSGPRYLEGRHVLELLTSRTLARQVGELLQPVGVEILEGVDPDSIREFHILGDPLTGQLDTDPNRHSMHKLVVGDFPPLRGGTDADRLKHFLSRFIEGGYALGIYGLSSQLPNVAHALLFTKFGTQEGGTIAMAVGDSQRHVKGSEALTYHAIENGYAAFPLSFDFSGASVPVIVNPDHIKLIDNIQPIQLSMTPPNTQL